MQIAQEILGIARAEQGIAKRGGGWLFTRFMLTGFAAHRAFEQISDQVFESYPYIVFALWKKAGEPLPPKRKRGAALMARREILRRLGMDAGVEIPPPVTLDQADAAVLAIAAKAGRSRSKATFTGDFCCH